MDTGAHYVMFYSCVEAEMSPVMPRYLVKETQMVDAWEVAAKDSPGYTFSALEEDPWKRVSICLPWNSAICWNDRALSSLALSSTGTSCKFFFLNSCSLKELQRALAHNSNNL